MDNDPMASYISREYLERDPRFTVAGEFTDGRKALCFLRGEQVDLILLELCMPDFSGEEFMKELLKQDIAADVIPVTAARTGERFVSALRLGAADFLMKPFTYERFRECLDRYAQRARIAESGGGRSSASCAWSGCGRRKRMGETYHGILSEFLYRTVYCQGDRSSARVFRCYGTAVFKTACGRRAYRRRYRLSNGRASLYRIPAAMMGGAGRRGL